MKPVLWFTFSLALFFLVPSCSNNDPSLASDPLGTGPFDAQGNYREEWANDPTKWRKPSNRHQAPPPDTSLPVIARNEQPPADANPLMPQGSSRTVTTKPAPTVVKVQDQPRETVRTTTPKPTPVVVKPKPKPKPVLVKAKPKPKPQPKTQRYLVKKGDTLSAIASRNGSSVSAIQRANGISGSLIRPGQSLVIPKR